MSNSVFCVCFFCFFFFKQKTAYEISACLVGSEMCIRDRVYSVCSPRPTNDQLALQETVFHNANGYLGVRGTLEEGAPQGMDTMRGAYVNGFYEIVPMKQAEKLTHVREDKESMINVADVQGIRFRLAGEWFSQWTGTLVESERRLDMDRGITERRVRWRSPEGRETALCFRRMASFAEPSLFLICLLYTSPSPRDRQKSRMPSSA